MNHPALTSNDNVVFSMQPHLHFECSIPISAVCDIDSDLALFVEDGGLQPCIYNYIMDLQQGVCIPWRLVYSIYLLECLCGVYMTFIMWTKEVYMYLEMEG